LMPLSYVADREILAEKTFQAAVSHKNCARTMMPNKRIFFTKMRRRGGNLREECCPTEAFFFFEAVYLAVSRA
ncbi:hypothetical protein KA005_26710, partial [bacterium]|nr:hypothetical protein [bacterium]